MDLSADIRAALDRAWNREVAENSIERWLGLCEAENWGRTPDNLGLLTRVFGASWYFTRFIFVNGREMAELVDRDPPADLSSAALVRQFEAVLELDGLEPQLERLRVLKNRVMLQILIAYLDGGLDQERCEQGLTCLAEATVDVITRLFSLGPGQTGTSVSVLGMGRMAGYEMTFGSDLDLIFLADGTSVDPQTDRQIRLLLRHIAMQTPTGSLYDVDMRLRPHGNAGVLVTTYRSFLEYHSDARDVWERQMMTRCRIVAHATDAVRELMQEVEDHVYGDYETDFLKSEIANMRDRVERELGRPAGKYEVKRGRGGLMDIDFISHFFQLAYGREHEELRTGSTREALRFLGGRGMLDGSLCQQLLEAYNFLKRVEMSLRLFDMKPISSFHYDPEGNTVLARAMGFYDQGPEAFIERYRAVIDEVRGIFNSILRD